MHVVVHHRAFDREAFLATDPQDIAGNAPPGVVVHHFLPAQDASAADCLWETPSVDALRNYLDDATRESCENSYFEVNSDAGMGLG